MKLWRGMTLPRGAMKLWWADAPLALLQRVYAETEAEVRYTHCGHPDLAIARVPWRRRISERFHARLRAMGIYVES